MVVALAGRRIDAPDAQASRFPSGFTNSVKQKLIICLSSVNATHLVSSGACGADLLALEAAEELGIGKTMILPFDADTFRSTSVTDRPGDWGIVYDKLVRVLKKENQLMELKLSKEDSEVYLETNFRILDQAQKIAEQSKQEIMALIVWEGKPKDADDTTYHFMQEAKKRNFIVKEILSNEI